MAKAKKRAVARKTSSKRGKASVKPTRKKSSKRGKATRKMAASPELLIESQVQAAVLGLPRFRGEVRTWD